MKNKHLYLNVYRTAAKTRAAMHLSSFTLVGLMFAAQSGVALAATGDAAVPAAQAFPAALLTQMQGVYPKLETCAKLVLEAHANKRGNIQTGLKNDLRSRYATCQRAREETDQQIIPKLDAISDEVVAALPEEQQRFLMEFVTAHTMSDHAVSDVSSDPKLTSILK